jgi:hypothetical protein
MYPMSRQQPGGDRRPFSFPTQNGGRIDATPGPVVSRHARRNPFFYLMRLRARIQYRQLMSRMDNLV